MEKNIRILICAVGTKGLNFVTGAAQKWPIGTVITYAQDNVMDDACTAIRELCKSNSIRCVENRHPSLKDFEPFDICFIVGWQYLLKDIDQRTIVFHDSLLPKYRGFVPTLTALIAGDKRIGATALSPNAVMDAGPVMAQEAIDITYPITLGEAFEKLSGCYLRMAEQLVIAAQSGTLTSLAKEQDESQATYSIWRDQQDQRIDWTKSSDHIQRFVNALTYPYTGARTWYEGNEIIVHEVSIEPEVAFAERFPGKLWQIRDNIPLIVCGTGMAKIIKATSLNDESVKFLRLRTRCV